MNAIATPTQAPVDVPQINRAHQVMGALRFPIFLLLWSLGVVVVSGIYVPADALVRQAPLEFEELAQVPTLGDTLALGNGLEAHLQQADVISGRWHPAPLEAVETLETVEAETAVTAVTYAEALSTAVAIAAVEAPAVQPALPVKPAQMKQRSQPADASVNVRIRPLADTTEHTTVVPLMGRTLLAKRQARTHLAAGRVLPAYQLLFAEMAGGAQDIEFLGLFAVAAYGSGRPAEAMLVYERLLTLEPDNERWSVGLGLCRERLGMDALPVYEKVVADAVSDSAVHAIALDRLQDLG